MNALPLVILLVEDDPGHATLIRRNLRRAGVVNEVVWAKDGQEALDYVRREDKHLGGGGCLVILLDINMPKVDGLEVLRQLKANEKTKQIPVMMLTTTDDPREIERCYELGCSVYVTKPVEYEKFREAVRQLGLFLQFVQVPPQRYAAGSE
ncbi:MAG: response regulator [Actinomycetota bacterium]|nr:response regulator [Actinomycetota bacterium]